MGPATLPCYNEFVEKVSFIMRLYNWFSLAFGSDNFGMHVVEINCRYGYLCAVDC